MQKNKAKKLMSRFVIGLIALLSTALQAQESQPTIAIIIDDLGDSFDRGATSIFLTGELTFSILPHKPYSKALAELAHDEGKEVMLHLPMQPLNSNKNMGPGGLNLMMDQEEVVTSFRASLASVPYVSGVNNHMGSLLTRQFNHMTWLMEAIKAEGNLYFVDSRTHASSLANFVATENELATTRRDVFLDHEIDLEKIEYYFHRLVYRAKKHGFALAIAHPHLETLQVLNYYLPKLAEFGVRMVSVSDYIQQQKLRGKTWHASLSPLPKAVWMCIFGPVSSQ